MEKHRAITRELMHRSVDWRNQFRLDIAISMVNYEWRVRNTFRAVVLFIVYTLRSVACKHIDVRNRYDETRRAS